MKPQPRQPDPDITAADLNADIEIAPGDVPASSKVDAFTDDGLRVGDGPDVHATSDPGDCRPPGRALP